MNLTELSNNIRKSLPLAFLVILVVFILYYAISLIFRLASLQKEQPAFLNAVFGKIKALEIEDASSSAGLTFRLDNVEGKPVTSTDSAKVFYMPPPVARFGYREKVYLMAQTLGFDTNITRYQLRDEMAVLADPIQELAVDIRNFNFTYQYNFENTPELFDTAVTPTTKQSQDQAIAFLQKIGRYPTELSLGTINTIFFKYDPKTKQLTQLARNIGANLVEIDFYRPNVDIFPAVSPSFFNSQNYVLLMINQEGEAKILKAQIKFFEKSDQQVGFYPVKTGDAAYNDLQEGRAWVISNPGDKQNVVIREMKIGYFDPDAPEDYLQPIYIFIGDDDFISYVPAVTEEYLIKDKK